MRTSIVPQFYSVLRHLAGKSIDSNVLSELEVSKIYSGNFQRFVTYQVAGRRVVTYHDIAGLRAFVVY
ncbi:MAG: hypothetical protein ACP5D2_00945 [Candidatus Nanoarchaeia archaeon]